MYTIRHTLLGNVRALFNTPNTQDKAPVQSQNPEQELLKTLEQIKVDATLTALTPEASLSRYKEAIQKAYPNDFGKQLDVIVKNEGAGNILNGVDTIKVRIALLNDVKVNNATESTKILIEVKKILELDKDNKDALVLQQKLVSINTSFEQGIAIVKKVTETQTSNLNREKYFSDKNVSFTGLLSMIKKEQGTDKNPKSALDALMKKFDQKGWDASRENDKDNTLLTELEQAGYLRFSGSAGSLEYGHKVVAALRDIQKNWKDYEKVVTGTEALDSSKFKVPQATAFDTWKEDNYQIANFLADMGGTSGGPDGILSQTNQVSRMGFLGIFGREDMNKKQLSELGAAKLLQDIIMKEGDLFWTKLGVARPTTIESMEGARRALFLRVALAGGNPDAIRDPSLADKVTNRQIKDQTKQIEANNKARFEAVKNALGEKNKELSPELLDQAGKSFITAVDVGGLLVGTGVSLEELARNTKIDGDNPKALTILSVGKKWETQLSKNIQAHFGAGASAGVDSNSGVFAGLGVDAGIKMIVQDNGKLSVAKGNQTLELNAGVGTSLLGFVPVGTVELAYRWNDVISALQSSDANTRNFLKGLFKTDDTGNITMVDISTKDAAIKELAGDDQYGSQDITMACEYAKNQLASKDLSPTEKVVAVQNFIENFARYNEIRNYQAKQGFHLAGIGFGVLAGPAVLAPFVRLIGQNIQGGYRVDAEKTKKLAETKSDIKISPDAIAKAPEDAKSLELLKQRGADITTDGRGIDVSKARFADIQVVGDTKKIELKNNIYIPVSPSERIVTIVQTSRDMNGAETYVLMLTTVPAEKKTEAITTPSSESLKVGENLNQDEKNTLKHIITWKDLPDIFPGDKIPFRKKYPEMESANNYKDGKYTMDLSQLQNVFDKMSKDTNLIKILPKESLVAWAQANNPVFLRAVLGTILALTSGSHASNKLGLRIGDPKNSTTQAEVNKYLDTGTIIASELAALKAEYPGITMTIEELKNLMKFNGGGNVTASNIPSNMYAESAYAKYGQNGTAVLPPEARIAGDIQKYTNEVIRQALIAKLEVPANLATAGFKKADYQTLLTTGKVAITTGTTPNTITKTYATTQSELHFARSAVTDKKTCFNAVFAITVPVDIKATWTENTIKTIDPKTGGFDIGTDTILTGANKADEASVSVTGRNMHESPPPPPPATKAPVTPAPAPTPTPAPVVVGTAPVATPAPGPVVAAPAPVATPTPVGRISQANDYGLIK